jgi:uncharacterized tellurite resistance protein B-like protein
MKKRIMGFFSKETDDPCAARGPGLHDPKIAACALFLEMSAIDGEFAEDERALILSALQEHYGLAEEDAADLVESANRERQGSIDLWQFTNRINENYTVEEKLRVIEIVWEIAYADGLLNKHEDYLVHKLADLLRLTHQQLIEAKLNVKAR